MGYKTIKPRWKKGESGNPKGRPPCLFTDVINEWKALGYKRVSKSEVSEAWDLFLTLSEDELRAIIDSKQKPMALRIVARSILSTKGAEQLEKIIDRTHGKPTQANENTNDNKGEMAVVLLPPRRTE